MAEIILGLGSNLGDKTYILDKANQLLAKFIGKKIKSSEYYQTKPWGFESDNFFVNSVSIFETEYSAFECLEIIHKIEKQLGRIRKNDGVYHDRTVDIDILFYDDLIIDTESLKVPHPLLTKRDFTLIPLNEIVPDFVHPVLKKTIHGIFLDFSKE